MPDPRCDGCGELYLQGTGREGYCPGCIADILKISERETKKDIY